MSTRTAIVPGIREHQQGWPLYRAMSVVIRNADEGGGHSHTRIGRGPSEVTGLEARDLLRAKFVTQFSDQFGTALEPTRKGRNYWEQADEAFMKLGGASPDRVAARYLGDPGGTLSWAVHLGGDSANWRALAAEDGRSWRGVIQQITQQFKSIHTRHGGTVDSVSIQGPYLRVYFDYDKAIDADDAFYDSERALKAKIDLMSRQDRGWEWALHGTVDGHSNLEIKNEAIEDGFN